MFNETDIIDLNDDDTFQNAAIQDVLSSSELYHDLYQKVLSASDDKTRESITLLMKQHEDLGMIDSMSGMIKSTINSFNIDNDLKQQLIPMVPDYVKYKILVENVSIKVKRIDGTNCSNDKKTVPETEEIVTEEIVIDI